MAQTLAELYVKIGSDFQKVDGDLSKLDHRIKGMDPSIQKMESGFGKVNKTILAMGGVIAGIGIAKFGSDIIGASTRMDSLNRAMITTEGSAQKASARMKEFVQIAKDPGLGLSQLAKGYIQLKSVGVGADLAVRSIRGIANAIALVGGGKEELERVTRQFVQMQGKGKVMAEDLMVIAESMPQIRKMAEQAFPAAAKSSKGLTEALQEMGVTGQQFIAGVTAEMAKLPKAADGAKNAQDNFTDALERFRAKLGDQILPMVTKLLNSLTDLMGKFEAMPASTQKMLGTAVVGGVGLLGIAATLTSIVSTIGLVKSGLSGLGVTSAGAGAAGVAGGTAAGAVAGRTIGSIALTAAKVSLIAGSVVFAYEAAKAITAIPSYPAGQGPFAEQMRMEGKTQTAHSKMTAQEMADYDAYFYPDGKPKGISQYKTAAGPIEPVKPIVLTPEEKEKLKKEAEKASEIYWTNWFDHAEAIAKQEYQVILGGMPSTLFQPSAWIEAQRVKYRDEAIPSMAGGVPAISGLNISRAGLTSGLGLGLEVSKATQEREKSILKIAKIEKDIDNKSAAERSALRQKDFDEVGSQMQNVSDDWNELSYDMEDGIMATGEAWKHVISSVKDNLIDLYDTLEPLLIKAGMGEKTAKNINTWVDGISRIMSAYGIGKSLYTGGAEIASKLGIGGKGAEMAGGIAEGGTAGGSSLGLSSGMKVAGPVAIAYGSYKVGSNYYKMFFGDEKVPPSQAKQYMQEQYHIGKYEDAVRGVYANTKGYEDAMTKLGIEPYPLAKGGWVMKPTIALMGEREPELVIPKSKLGSSGLGGNTHIEIHNINMPTMDRAMAENVVVQAVEDAKRHNRI
jgi:tape measure domain-containing protein